MSRPMSLDRAIAVLKTAGVSFFVAPSEGSLSLESASRRLDVSTDWMREHLDEFPNAWRLPAASSGLNQPAGQLRIPIRDLDAFEDRRKIKKAA